MKTWGSILKIMAALIAIAGIVLVIVKYGDKIVGWTRSMLYKIGLRSRFIRFEDDEELDAVIEAEDADFAG